MRAPSASSTTSPGLLDGLSADTLLRRAIESARSIYIRKGTSEPRWVAVRNCLHVTGAQARGLCGWAELDPDELVRR